MRLVTGEQENFYPPRLCQCGRRKDTHLWGGRETEKAGANDKPELFHYLIECEQNSWEE